MINNIKYLRKNRGLSMQALAALCKTSQQQIDRLEKSKRRITADWLEKLSKALGCKPTELVNFTNEAAKPKRVATASANIIGAIETKFNNHIRKFADDEVYEITFRPTKNDLGKDYFGLVVEGNYFGFGNGTELIFVPHTTKTHTSHLAEAAAEFLGAGNTPKIHKFKIEGDEVSGMLIKSLRSE
jgi:transcriptional regulator with XRE-family HTH domain